jgi:hypothetical protein
MGSVDALGASMQPRVAAVRASPIATNRLIGGEVPFLALDLILRIPTFPGLYRFAIAFQEPIVFISCTGRDPSIQVEWKILVGRDPLPIITPRQVNVRTAGDPAFTGGMADALTGL